MATFEAGDQIRCCWTDGGEYLTVGALYTVIDVIDDDEDAEEVLVRHDGGDDWWYIADKFDRLDPADQHVDALLSAFGS